MSRMPWIRRSAERSQPPPRAVAPAGSLWGAGGVEAGVEWRRDVLFEGAQPLEIEEEPAVAEAVPADEVGEVIGAEVGHQLLLNSSMILA